MPGFAHLGGGGGGVLLFCADPWLSTRFLFISGRMGEFVLERLLKLARFWWKLEVEEVFEENLLLLENSTIDLEVWTSTLLVVPVLVLDSKGLRTLLSTLWITGEGQRTLWTRLGEMSFWESFSLGESFSSLSFLASNGSLNVVKFKVFGGVGLGWRGNDEAKVDVVTVLVGEELAEKKLITIVYKIWSRYFQV